MTWFKNSEGRYGANGAKGDQGEKLVEEYCKLNSIPYKHLSDIKSQVRMKIDCVIEGTLVDVKTNVSKGNLVVELYSSKDKPGWLYTTMAEYIYGVDLENKHIYRYNVNDMIRYVNENKEKARKIAKGDVLMWVSVDNDFIERLL